MKKSLKYLSILLALVLVITGCGKKKEKTVSNEESATKMSETFKKTYESKGFAVKADINFDLSGLGMKATLTGDVYNGETPSSHINMTSTVMGKETKNEMYTVVKDNKQYTYEKSDNKGWQFTTAEYKKETFSMEELEKYIKEAKEVKNVKSDKDGYEKYEISIDGSKITSLLKSLDSSSAKDSKELKDLVFTVYTKDGYLAILDADLSDYITEAFGSSLGGAKITAKISLEMSNHGKVSEITVPQDVVSSAKETKELENPINLFN